MFYLDCFIHLYRIRSVGQEANKGMTLKEYLGMPLYIRKRYYMYLEIMYIMEECNGKNAEESGGKASGDTKQGSKIME